jgi:hypothetical protein
MVDVLARMDFHNDQRTLRKAACRQPGNHLRDIDAWWWSAGLLGTNWINRHHFMTDPVSLCASEIGMRHVAGKTALGVKWR